MTGSTDARERIRALTSPTPAGGPLPPLPGPGLSRNPSSATSNTRTNPSRGLSVRRPGMPAPTLNVPGVSPNRPSPTDRARTPAESRPAESFYDNYMDAYADNAQVQSAPPLSRSQSSRIGNWARNNATPLPPLPAGVGAPQRTRSVAPSSYAPSSAGGTMRRRTTRRVPRSKSMYEEEEEGYGSGGDYEETVYEMSKIRIKVIYHRIHLF